MKSWFKSLQIKGFVMGVLVTIMASGTIMVVANSQTVSRNITYGVQVSLDGQVLQLPDDSQPFIMGNRTFLPVRAIADAVNLPVDFDASANMVHLGNRHAGLRRPLREAAPHFNSSNRIQAETTASLGGVTHQNAIRFDVNDSGTGFTTHNLDGQFRNLTFTFGGVDGAPNRNTTLRIIGDGVTLLEQTVNSNALPIQESVFVEGVRELRITVSRQSTVSLSFAEMQRAIPFGFIGYLE